MTDAEFLEAHPTFDVQDIESLKMDGKYDEQMLKTWHKQLKTNELTGSGKPVYMKAI